MGDTLRDHFLLLSPDSLDPFLRPIVEKWDDVPTALQLLEVLDHAIHGALASGVVVATLQALYYSTHERQGTKHEDLVPLATWRLELGGTP